MHKYTYFVNFFIVTLQLEISLPQVYYIVNLKFILLDYNVIYYYFYFINSWLLGTKPNKICDNEKMYNCYIKILNFIIKNYYQ